MSSDFVSSYNNKEMADLERRIRALYSHAHDEILQDSSEQWKKIEEDIRDKYEEYQAGKISQQDYYAWVNGNKKLAKIKDQTAANIADRMVDSANVASSYINSTTPNIFAENANREAYKIEKGLKGSVSFSLIDDDALQKIMTGNTVEFNAKWKDTFTDPPKIYNWTYSKVQDSVYIGMLKGESMKKVADRIQQVTGSDEATAIRNARTSVISASNQGKMATFERAAKMGIKVKKEWVSARDNRVRDSHAALNGVQVEWDKKFPNGLKCPCDPSGRPEEVYNCRCTMVRVPFDEEDTSGNTEKSYQAWKEAKEVFTSPEFKGKIKEQNNYLKSIMNGELSPLVSYPLYSEMNKRIENEIIGITTVNGIEIKGYVPHFTARVFGSVEQRRNGIELEDVIDALTNNETSIGFVQKRDKKLSQIFNNGKIDVSINPSTGDLIQANPNRKKKRKDEKNKRLPN